MTITQKQVNAVRARLLAFVLTSVLIAPVLAAPNPSIPSQSTYNQRLAEYERIVFGRPANSGTVAARLINLETNVYGTAHEGTVDSRLDALKVMVEVPAAALQATAPKPTAPKTAASKTAASKTAASKTAASKTAASKTASSKTATPKTAASKTAAAKVETAAENPNMKKGHVVENKTLSVQTDSLMRQGMQLYTEGRLSAAESVFRSVTAVDQRCEDAYFDLGTLQEKRGDLKGAVHNYELAANIDPADMELQDALTSAQKRLTGGQLPIAKFSPPENASAQLDLPKEKTNGSKHLGKAIANCAHTLGRSFFHNGGLDIGCPICHLLSF